jgi:hypothetical protein
MVDTPEKHESRYVSTHTDGGSAGWIIAGAVLAIAIIAGVIWFNSGPATDPSVEINNPPAIEVNPVTPAPETTIEVQPMTPATPDPAPVTPAPDAPATPAPAGQ